jgi:broad specificity phosphatase PhoE
MSAPAATRLWLVRHGETTWSLSGQHTGRTDIPLTPHGVKQAELLGRRLTGHKFELVLTSPLQRARETCRLAGELASAHDDPDLMEWDYGAFEGRTAAEIQREIPGWSIWTSPASRGETADQVGARADRVIARALAAGGDVALFAHGHILRILSARWLRLPAIHGRHLALDTASLSLLDHEHDERVIRTWNQSYRLVDERDAPGP